MPYIMDITFYRHGFEQINNKLKDIQFLKLMKPIKTITYRMGLSESSLTTLTKPSSCLSHCKVSCGSPCCTKARGEDSQCVFNIDTHENANSDSDSEDTDKHVSK